eukprot:m.31440 g.31440  ORF g.31440 m.31440 type:complete len:377 (+) comp8317_c0_seq1:263-1393(+)
MQRTGPGTRRRRKESSSGKPRASSSSSSALASDDGPMEVQQNDHRYMWDPTEFSATKNVFKGVGRSGKEVIKKVSRYSDSGQGVPYHIVREVSILKGINHPNVISLLEVIHKEEDVSLVYEFLPKDLRELLDIKREWIMYEDEMREKTKDRSISDWRQHEALHDKQMKDYFRQILEGVSFLHSRCILHRDLKPTDLRINERNVLKISNFRLARTFTLPLRTYTHEVVTLWYRAPEILLGKKRYDTSIDMWSAGCILAEIITGEAIFMGDSEIDQLYQIFKVMGTPTPAIWPGIRSLPDYKATFPKWPQKTFEEKVKGICSAGEDLLNQLLCYDSTTRLTARRALSHNYFDELKSWTPPAARPTLPPHPPKENGSLT